MNTMTASQVCRTLHIMSRAEDALNHAGNYIIAFEIASVRSMLTEIAVTSIGINEPKQTITKDAEDTWSEKKW